MKEKAAASPRIPSDKGRELAGLGLATLAILLLASLLSFDPADPSLLHQGSRDGAPLNLVGAVGANVAALAYGVLGWSCLLFPFLLWGLAWRYLRRGGGAGVPGRGIGAALSGISLPVLLQLLFGQTTFRGAPFEAGGALGRIVGELLVDRLAFAGSLVVVVALCVAGASLLVQSTLIELLARWRQRLGELAQRWALWWGRRRSRHDRERQRQRVVEKHLRRRLAEQPTALETEEDVSEGQPSVRVVERPGPGGFAVRRVRTPTSAPEEPTAMSTPKPALQAPLFEAREGAELPPLNLLRLEPIQAVAAEDELIRLGEVIRSSCVEFGVEGSIEGITPGPVITVFELQPAPGVKVSQIVNLQDDLALAMKAESVRIDRLPGRSTLGIEVPNSRRTIIRLGHLLEQERFRRAPSPLTMALGTTIHGEPYFADLATMPHLLVAGATGAGKSAGLQSMITSILYKARRDEVQFIFIDPKRIELGAYAEIPHLKTEVVVEPKKAANALRWAVAEMERRYRLLAEVHVRSIDYYNRAIRDPEVQRRLSLKEGEDSELSVADLAPLPYYVIVIDELADLMMVAAAEVETSIARLAQMARAVGIHLIVATQRPSVDVLTGTIKANFPCRMAFATASRHDSRTILDQVGSEKLLGKGDMLFMPQGTSRLLRLHGAYVSEEETASLVRWLKKQGRPALDPSVVEFSEVPRGETGGNEGEDELFDEAARLVVAERKASASFLQRRMRIGFSRAARLIDLMEQDGLLGPSQGSKPREVLVPPDYFSELDGARGEY